MRKFIIQVSLLSLTLTTVAYSALADTSPPTAPPEGSAPTAPPAIPSKSGLTWGGDVLLTVPFGDMADVTGMLLGVDLRLMYYVMPQLEAYVRAGYQRGMKKDGGTVVKREADTTQNVKMSYAISNIPIYVGGRYFVMKPAAGLYGNFELGVNNLMPVVTMDGTDKSGDMMTRFGANIGGGYLVSSSHDAAFDVGAQISLLNLAGKDSGESSMTALNVFVGFEW